MRKTLAIILLVFVFVTGFMAILVMGAPWNSATDSTETTKPTEEILIDPSEWFVTDTKPSQFTDETYPPRETEGTIATTPTVEETIIPTEPTTVPTEPEKIYPELEINWYGDKRVYATGEITTEVCGGDIDRDFLAKMVYSEAGGEDWWCQVYTCSAILNHCEVSNMTLWECGHDGNHFAVAPYVDRIVPSEMSYEVVDYVLSGGRIEGICYFRTKRYHGFGEPMCKIGAHYFSIE